MHSLPSTSHNVCTPHLDGCRRCRRSLVTAAMPPQPPIWPTSWQPALTYVLYYLRVLKDSWLTKIINVLTLWTHNHFSLRHYLSTYSNGMYIFSKFYNLCNNKHYIKVTCNHDKPSNILWFIDWINDRAYLSDKYYENILTIMWAQNKLPKST